MFLNYIKQLYSVHADIPDLSNLPASHFSPLSFT